MTRINGLDYPEPPWEPCAVDDHPAADGEGRVLLRRYLTACLRDWQAKPGRKVSDILPRALGALAAERGVPEERLAALARDADWFERARRYLDALAADDAAHEQAAAERERRARTVAYQADAARLAGSELRLVELNKQLETARRRGAGTMPARELEILLRVAGVTTAAPVAAPPVAVAEPDFAAMTVEQLDAYAAAEATLAAAPRRSVG